MKKVLLAGIGILILFVPPLCLAGRNVSVGRENAELRRELDTVKKQLLIEEAQLHKERSLLLLISKTKK